MSYPLSFLLGAGASAPYSVPMMAGFYAQFRDYVENRHPECFLLLKDLESKADRKTNDLETLLTDLQLILGGTKAMSLLGVSQTDDVKEKLETARQLRGYLDAFIVDTCERFDREKSERELKAILELGTIAPLNIFTTNYDRVPEYVCEQMKLPFSDGFDAEGSQPVANWSGSFIEAIRIIKLHGSVNWYVDTTGKVFHRLDRGYPLPTYDFHLSRNDQILKPLMIIPTLEKEVFGDPYSKLSSLFSDVLRETKVLVIAGNSLRDLHIKSQIVNRMQCMRVIIVSPNASKNINILEAPERTYPLDIGFSELLTLGGNSLKELMEEVNVADEGNDTAINEAIEKFTRKVTDKFDKESVIKSDPELAKLYQNIKSEKVSIRISAVNALATHSHPAITALLIDTMKTDESTHVRAAAVASIFNMSNAEAIDAIRTALLEEKFADVQVEAILAISQLEDTKRSQKILTETQMRSDLESSARLILDEFIKKD